MTTDINSILKIFKNLKSERLNLDSKLQTVADLVYTEKSEITRKSEAYNTFTNSNLYDKTANNALVTRASALLSLLWDSGKFRIAPNPEYFNSNDNSKFFQLATEMTKTYLRRSQTDRILFESEMDEGAFGTSYIYISENDDNDGVNLNSIDIKECYISEGKNNIIDSIYREYELSIKVAYETFQQYATQRIKNKYANKKYDEKVKILHVITKRDERNLNLKGKDNLPFASIYIDLEENKEMRKDGIQSGFEYFPVVVSRENKKSGEKYGYSVSMLAIEEIAQLNAVKKDQIIISNRMANPAIGFDAQSLQGNVLNTSPGSATPFRLMGRASTPIFDMIPTRGDLNGTEIMIERLRNTISKYYGIDRLIDFNNETEMTLGEAQLRAQIRKNTLGATLIKKQIEKYEPIVKRAFAILLSQGKFGYMDESNPGAISKSKLGLGVKLLPDEITKLLNANIDPSEFVNIEWFTQFEIEQRLLENNTILQVWNNAGLIAQLTNNPEVFDNLNYDKTIKAVGDVSFNIDIFNDESTVDQIRQGRSEQVANEQTLNAGKELSEINKNLKN